MRLWPLMGALLSLLGGSTVETGERPDAPAGRVETRADAGGFGVAGENFYVWDEERRFAEEWARELQGR